MPFPKCKTVTVIHVQLLGSVFIYFCFFNFPQIVRVKALEMQFSEGFDGKRATEALAKTLMETNALEYNRICTRS